MKSCTYEAIVYVAMALSIAAVLYKLIGSWFEYSKASREIKANQEIESKKSDNELALWREKKELHNTRLDEMKKELKDLIKKDIEDGFASRKPNSANPEITA